METSYDFLKRLEGKLVSSKEYSVNIWNYCANVRWGEHFIILKVTEMDNGKSSFAVIDVLTKQGLFQIQKYYNSGWNQYCWVKGELKIVE